MSDDGLPSWPTIISMMAASVGGLVMLAAHAFGWTKPRCELCETTDLRGRFIIASQRLCSSCFQGLRT